MNIYLSELRKQALEEAERTGHAIAIQRLRAALEESKTEQDSEEEQPYSPPEYLKDLEFAKEEDIVISKDFAERVAASEWMEHKDAVLILRPPGCPTDEELYGDEEL